MEDIRMTETTGDDRPLAEVVPLRQAAEVSYEVDLDDAPEPSPPALVDPALPAVRRLPVIPVHLRTAPGVRAALARQAGMAAHRAAYHGLRSPKYVLLGIVWAVAGVFRVLGRQIGW